MLQQSHLRRNRSSYLNLIGEPETIRTSDPRLRRALRCLFCIILKCSLVLQIARYTSFTYFELLNDIISFFTFRRFFAVRIYGIYWYFYTELTPNLYRTSTLYAPSSYILTKFLRLAIISFSTLLAPFL